MLVIFVSPGISALRYVSWPVTSLPREAFFLCHWVAVGPRIGLLRGHKTNATQEPPRGFYHCQVNRIMGEELEIERLSRPEVKLIEEKLC